MNTKPVVYKKNRFTIHKSRSDACAMQKRKPFVTQLLPIKEVQWEPLIPLIGRANRALAQYGGILEGVPNPEVLLAPLTTEEAVLSSRIEGTQATLGEVYRFEAGEAPEKESRRQD